MIKYLVLIFSLLCHLEANTVFWFTGLPCSGKTTIGRAICEKHPEFVHLDGDEIRKILNFKLGFSLEDRKKNLESIAELAISKFGSTKTVVVTTISPLESHRNHVCDLIEKSGAQFFLVYIDTDLETCIERDVKGMYAKALKGEIKEFTGISSPYEPPKDPDLLFKTPSESLDEIVSKFDKFTRSVEDI